MRAKKNATEPIVLCITKRKVIEMINVIFSSMLIVLNKVVNIKK